MYDNHIEVIRFIYYRDLLSRIYRGEDTETKLDDLQEEIQNDYEAGLLSSSQYDNLISLAQDIIASDRFFYYRDLLSRIYQGENTKTKLDDLQEEIQNDYEAGLLSSSQYDNLISLAQDI